MTSHKARIIQRAYLSEYEMTNIPETMNFAIMEKNHNYYYSCGGHKERPHSSIASEGILNSKTNMREHTIIKHYTKLNDVVLYEGEVEISSLNVGDVVGGFGLSDFHTVKRVEKNINGEYEYYVSNDKIKSNQEEFKNLLNKQLPFLKEYCYVQDVEKLMIDREKYTDRPELELIVLIIMSIIVLMSGLITAWMLLK